MIPIPEPFHRERLHPGQGWSRVLLRHQVLSLRSEGDGACVALFAFNARRPSERYNMPDTLKAQHTAHLRGGRVLMSDMGRAMLGIIADDCGWHDPLCGHQLAADSLVRYGALDYQSARNDRHRNTRDNALVEFAKHDLDARDLHANLNLFAKIVADDAGRLHFIDGHARAGQLVALRAEQDVLIVLSNTPHPLDPRPRYAPPPLSLAIARGLPPAADDPCRISSAEAGRAYALSEGDAP